MRGMAGIHSVKGVKMIHTMSKTVHVYGVIFIVWNISCSASVLLRCYHCPAIQESTVSESNLQCLSNGYNVSCDVITSRCYTRVDGKSVEKGCITVDRCHIGNEYLCCGLKYCNGGHGLYPQTGYGQDCDTNSDCVQGEQYMQCDIDNLGNKVCLCKEGNRRKKAICIPNETPKPTPKVVHVITTFLLGYIIIV